MLIWGRDCRWVEGKGWRRGSEGWCAVSKGDYQKERKMTRSVCDVNASLVQKGNLWVFVCFH